MTDNGCALPLQPAQQSVDDDQYTYDFHDGGDEAGQAQPGRYAVDKQPAYDALYECAYEKS